VRANAQGRRQQSREGQAFRLQQNWRKPDLKLLPGSSTALSVQGIQDQGAWENLSINKNDVKE
jgi:hypothetical protein